MAILVGIVRGIISIPFLIDGLNAHSQATGVLHQIYGLLCLLTVTLLWFLPMGGKGVSVSKAKRCYLDRSVLEVINLQKFYNAVYPYHVMLGEKDVLGNYLPYLLLNNSLTVDRVKTELRNSLTQNASIENMVFGDHQLVMARK